MPTLSFIEANTPEEVRTEVVKYLREQEAKARAEAKDAKGANEKKVAERAAYEMRAAAEHWENLWLGHPMKGGKPPPALAAKAG
jgi:hypothetical protein